MAKETTFEHPPKGHFALLAYDSANDTWRAVYVDASGNLQVDVVSSGLPTGGATEATLAELSARVGDESSPASGTVNKQLADLLTELNAKLETADLNLDAAGDLQVDVKTLPGDGLQLRRGDHTVTDYDAVPGDTSSHDLVNVSGAGVLEYLSFTSDHASSYMSVNLDGDWLVLVDVANIATQTSMMPAHLQGAEKLDSIWQLMEYDAANNQYGFCLRRPLWFNTSLRVLYHAGSAAAKIALGVGYHLF